MANHNTLIKGTLILTLAGFLTRIIGFFYRIFLSQTIGAEGMGIYQLIFPIHTLCFALTVSGIQTAISRFVAAKCAVKDENGARNIFLIGTGMCVILSITVSFFLYRYAAYFADAFLDELRCSSLLRLMAWSIPFGTFHSCVNAYYYARSQTGIPAVSQLLEQISRVLASYIFYLIILSHNQEPTPIMAVFGILGGEVVSMLFSSIMITWDFKKYSASLIPLEQPWHNLQEILILSIPLTCNRVLLTLLQSAEAVLIPGRLRLYGLSTSDALSIYGILTGMSLPLILFPSTITNSISVMLLPAVAEDQARENHASIRRTILLTIRYCLILGFCSTAFFFLFGNWLGLFLFKSVYAGAFIKTLSFICPFLYLTTTLTSILNGLGKTGLCFLQNTIGLSLRILFVLLAIPRFGITGYLWGLLAGELIISLLCLIFLRQYIFTK
ncbi:MAG: putative polysaccharide biosynthesis protein [Lachnospiraceae bacterium]|jgi:stage V sporulation protein B